MKNFRVEELKKENVEDVFEIEKTFFNVSDKSSILSSFDSDTLFYFGLFLDEKIVGYYECSVVLDEAEIYEIAIKTEEQGNGYSLLLMEHLFEFCDKKKVNTIFLEVNRINSKAISLYNKFGFKEYSVRKNYYGENDAILMKWSRK